MKIIAFLPLLFISILLSAQKQTRMTIYFDSDKAIVRPGDAKLLDSLVSTFQPGVKNISIEITGHCDGVGSDGYNDTLSLKRVKAVKQYLLARGVDQLSITNELGYGSTMPAVDECTIYHRHYNRRAELAITEGNSIFTETTLTKIIADTGTKTGTNIILKNLNFEGGTHHLLNNSLPILNDLLNVLKMNENLVIQVEGHICCEPNAADGYDYETHTNNLSEERAKAIYSYLVKNGVTPERLSYKGYGHQKPMYNYPEKNEKERIMNRRVEIKIIQK